MWLPCLSMLLILWLPCVCMLLHGALSDLSRFGVPTDVGAHQTPCRLLGQHGPRWAYIDVCKMHLMYVAEQHAQVGCVSAVPMSSTSLIEPALRHHLGCSCWQCWVDWIVAGLVLQASSRPVHRVISALAVNLQCWCHWDCMQCHTVWVCGLGKGVACFTACS